MVRRLAQMVKRGYGWACWSSKAFNNPGRCPSANEQRAQSLSSFRRTIELPGDPRLADTAERKRLAERAIRNAIAEGMTSLNLFRGNDFRLLLLDPGFPVNVFTR